MFDPLYSGSYVHGCHPRHARGFEVTREGVVGLWVKESVVAASLS